jgi:hypothetical protein
MGKGTYQFYRCDALRSRSSKAKIDGKCVAPFKENIGNIGFRQMQLYQFFDYIVRIRGGGKPLIVEVTPRVS